MAGKSKFSSKLLMVFFVLTLLVCPYIFLGMMFVPQAIGFLEPVICPGDMEMDVVSETGYDSDGSFTRATIECSNGRETVGATWKVFLIMFGIPAIGIALFFMFTPAKPEEPEKITLNPDGIE